MSADLRRSRSERLYAALLWLYPSEFRLRFGEDMRELFVDQLREEHRHAGRTGATRLWLRILPDLLGSAAREHVSTWRERLLSFIITDARPQMAPATGDSMVEMLLQDLRYTARILRKSPAFSLVAMLVIALGSGAVSTIFSAANALVLRPIPGVTQPDRLVEISRGNIHREDFSAPASYPFYTRLRDGAHALNGIAAWAPVSLTLSTGGEGTVTFANFVSGNYFSVLGVRPALGRFFVAEEGRTPGGDPVLVLSDGFWRGRFGGDSSLVGRRILLNGAPYTVIGIAPPRFSGVVPMIRTDAWVPLTMAPRLGSDPGSLTNPRSAWLMLFGRLNDGVSIEQARADGASTISQMIRDDPSAADPSTGIAMSRLTGFPADTRGAILGFVTLLLVMSALVLVIASVNVAGMLLARATARQHEIAVRIALGAGRGRLVRQLLTESVVLFLGGAAGGFLLALWSTRLFSRIRFPATVPVNVDLSPDYRVLVFSLATALLTGLIFGLAPALEATRSDPRAGFRSGSTGSAHRRSPLRNGLVIGQMAISLLLLMSAGLFLQALGRGQQVPMGFETAHVVTTPIDVGSSGYGEVRARLFYDALRQKLLASPGVAAVSYAQIVPLTNLIASSPIRIDGYVPPKGEHPNGLVDVNLSAVAPDYFTALRIPLLRGRDFLPTDDATAPRVAVVNESFAATYWAGTDPIGREFFEDSTVVTVVGVVRDAKYASLDEPLAPFRYVPLAQQWQSATNLFVRTSADASMTSSMIRNAVREVDPLLPPPSVVTMDAATSVALLPQRVAAAVTGAMGGLGLILAVVGLYGVVAYTVSQRTREIGVRMALGADRRSVLGMIVRDGMRLVGIGAGIGMVLALAATRVMARFLFGVSPLDPLVFAVIPLGLGAATLVASYLPARRAAATNPIEALRDS